MKKILTVVGARPQFIKMALVSRALKALEVSETVVNTGQHYDWNLSGIFFRDLRLPKADYNLNVGSTSPNAQIAQMIDGVGRAIKKESPAIVLVYGDTNSTLAASLAAVKSGVKLAHVEAGLRSFNKSMPEEVNRVLADASSDIFFCPTKAAVGNLRREGHDDGIHLVGDVMYDSIKRIYGRKAVSQGREDYILCTIHRAGNTDDPKNLKNIFSALGSIGRRVIMPIHPRTAKCMRKYKITAGDNVAIINPLGYMDMLELERRAALVVTDSGGVQKEALIFNVPCITLRPETEWVETVESGWNRLAGPSSGPICKAIRSALTSLDIGHKSIDPEKFYGDGYAHKRIAKVLCDKLRGA